MSTVDLIVLTILKRKEEIPLSEVVKKIRTINMKKTPSKGALYSRLNILKSRQLVNVLWKEGRKFYLISQTGEFVLTEFENQLYESKSN